MLRLKHVFTACATLLTITSFAHAQADNGLIAAKQANDNWADETAVSGNFIVGVRGLFAAKEEATKPSAWVPKSFAGQKLCYVMFGDNGRYYGEQDVEVVADWKGGFTTIPVKSQYDTPPQNLAALSPDQAFGHLSTGPCGVFQENRASLISIWNSSAKQKPSGVTLYIDTKPNERLLSLVNGSNKQPCRRLRNKTHLYKVVCDIQFPSQVSGNTVDLEILRYRPAINSDGDITEQQRNSIFLTVTF